MEATEQQDTTFEGSHLLELWSDREEIHVLPEIMRPDEGLVCVASGTLLRSGRLASSRWLVVLTDRRLLCIKGRVAVTRKVIEMPVSAIRSVDMTGFMAKTLILDTGYGNIRVTSMKKAQAIEMVEGLSALMRAVRGEDQPHAALKKAKIPSANDGLAATVDMLRAEVDSLRERVSKIEADSLPTL